MRSRSTARLVSLAALLPLLVVAVAGFGYDRFRCAFSGQITDMGCCPTEEAPALPVVNAATCCDHEVARMVHAPAEVPGSRAFATLEAPTALPRAFDAPPPGPLATPTTHIGAIGPPLPPPLQLKQSLLI